VPALGQNRQNRRSPERGETRPKVGVNCVSGELSALRITPSRRNFDGRRLTTPPADMETQIRSSFHTTSIEVDCPGVKCRIGPSSSNSMLSSGSPAVYTS